MKLLLALFTALAAASSAADPLTLSREANWLIIKGPHLPGEIRINYLEAYCRAGSTDADWVKHTVISHKSEVVSATPGKVVLRDVLADGLVVDHVITAGADEVDFEMTARNPTAVASEAHWAQPCVRLSKFLGLDESTAGNAEDYLPKCFIFLDGKLTRMPTPQWEKKARYTPGQTWAASHVPRSDVNPRPLNPLTPSSGLIGCFSADEKLIWATAWEPYQELFQGVARCLHSDPRIGGLAPGETKKIHGRIYVVANDLPALLARYRKDFPGQK
jgi:hypothetical protein